MSGINWIPVISTDPLFLVKSMSVNLIGSYVEYEISKEYLEDPKFLITALPFESVVCVEINLFEESYTLIVAPAKLNPSSSHVLLVSL